MAVRRFGQGSRGGTSGVRRFGGGSKTMPAPKKKDDGPSGWWERTTDVVGDVAGAATAIPGALIGIAGDVTTELANRPGISYGGAQGPRAARITGPPEKRAGESLSEYNRRVRPFTVQTAESFSRTGGRAVNLAASAKPGGLRPSETEYAKAWERGDIAHTLLEDIGNAAILGAPVARGVSAAASRATAKAATAEAAAVAAETAGAANAAALRAVAEEAAGRAAGLQARAASVTKVVRGADQASAAPARIWTAPITGVDLRVPTVGRVHAPGVADLVRASGVAPRLAASRPGQAIGHALQERGLDPEARALGRQTRDEILLPLVGEKQLGGRAVVNLTRAAEKKVGDPDVMRAAIDVQSGKWPVYQTALNLPEASRSPFLERTFGIENAPTDRALQIADDYVNGRLPQAQREAMDAAWQLGPAQMSRMHEEMALAGAGRQGAPALSEEQLGDVPMPSKIEERLFPRRQQVEQIQKELEGDTDAPGLRSRALAARARVPEVDLAEQVSERAARRVERAGAVEGEAGFASRRAGQLRAAQGAAEDRAAVLRGEPTVVPDEATSPVERGAVRAERAGTRAARAEAEGAAARGRIFQQAGREAARSVIDEGGLFAPENRARIRPEDITPEAVRPELERVDAALRGTTADVAVIARVELLDLFQQKKLPYTAKERPRTVGDRGRNAAGEWDWFYAMSEADQAWLRRNWMQPKPTTGTPNVGSIDTMMEEYLNRHGNPGEIAAHESAAAEFVRRAREVDSLERLARGVGDRSDFDRVEHLLGNRPMVQRGELDLGDARGSLPDRVSGRRGNGPKQLRSERAGTYAEHLRERIAEIERGPEPPSELHNPGWRMPREQFEREVASLEEIVRSAARRLDESDDPWMAYTAEETAARNRLSELLPEHFDRGDLAASHWALVEAAEKHGYEIPEHARYEPEVAPTRGQIHDEAGGAAVRQAETDALDALERDLQVHEAYRRDNLPVPGEQLEYGYLTPGQKAIYREARARARKVGAEQALSEARRRVVGRLTAEGERTGHRVGRAEGRARVFETEAARMERSAESAGARAPEAVEQARAGLEQSMARPVRAGERKGIAEQKARELERTVRSKERRMEWLEDRIAEDEARFALGPEEVAPGKYRTPLLMAERAKRALTEMAEDLAELTGDPTAGWALLQQLDSLPAMMADLHARGIFPEYVIGGTEQASRTGNIGSQQMQLPRRRKLGSQREKVSGDTPATYRGLARRYVKEINDIAENNATAAMEQKVAVMVGDYLQQKLDSLDPADVETRRHIEILLDGGRAEDIAAHIHRDGMTPWDPASPYSSANPKNIGVDSLLLPTSVFRQYRRWFKPAESTLLKRMIDRPTTVWKHMVLALNPHWNIGNIAGNTMMASIAGGVSPWDMVKYGQQARRLLKEEGLTGEVHFPPRLYGAGMGGEQSSFLTSRGPGESNLVQRGLERGGRVGRTLAHPIQSSYNLNSFVDDWGRSTVYLAKRAKGFSEEGAVREALKAMGDFSRMTPLEKEVVRRVFPFYAWSRHVTQLAFRLPLEHPFRVAWTLHVADTFAPEEEEGLPRFLHGSIKLGADTYLSTGGLSPFGDMASLPFAPNQVFRGVNPIGKAIVAAGLGVNLGKQRVFTRPFGTGPIDAYGNPRLGPLRTNELLYYLGQQTPQTRLFQAATQDPVLRYDTGDPMTSQGRELPMEGSTVLGGPRLSPRMGTIAQQTGLPIFTTTYRLQEAQARKAKKDALRRRAAARRAAR